MASETLDTPDPRRKRAFYIVGAIGLAAIAWNFDGWDFFGGDNDDHGPVSITIDSDAPRGDRVKVEFSGGDTVSDGDVEDAEEVTETGAATDSAAQAEEAEQIESGQGGPAPDETQPEEEAETGYMM